MTAPKRDEQGRKIAKRTCLTCAYFSERLGSPKCYALPVPVRRFEKDPACIHYKFDEL